MSEPSMSESRIPLGVHAHLTGTIAVAGTVPALVVFLLARPTEIMESTALWFVLFPLTCALAGGVFTPKIRRHLPASYPRADRQWLRAVVFTAGLLVAGYAIGIALLLVSIFAGVMFQTADGSSPLIPGLFVVLSAVAVPPLPSVYVHRKYRKATAEFVHEAKSRGIAAVLALLGGGLGAHRFYVGERRAGAKYLLFCWTIVPWVLGIRAANRYVQMDPADFRRKVAENYGEPLPDEEESVSDAADDRTESPTSGERTNPDESEYDDAEEFSSVGEPLSSDESPTDAPAGSTDDAPSPDEFFSQDGEPSVESSSEEPPSSDDGKLDELERLYDLYEEGALTEEEYERTKARLLDGE